MNYRLKVLFVQLMESRIFIAVVVIGLVLLFVLIITLIVY
jgi:hypothetical protein